MFRIIHSIAGEGTMDREHVHITEDMKAESSDFIAPGFVLTSDTKHDPDLPTSFPLEYTFERE